MAARHDLTECFWRALVRLAGDGAHGVTRPTTARVAGHRSLSGQLFLDDFAQDMEEEFVGFLNPRCSSARSQNIQGGDSFGKAAVAAQEANALESFPPGFVQCEQHVL